MEYFIDTIKIDEIIIKNQNFTYLLESHKSYYEKQLNNISSNFINNLAKVFISQYRLKYYATLNQLIKNNDVDRSEFDFYNMNSFDSFLENTENTIKVFSENDLKILKSIINIADIFLRNALNENNFESLINSFYKLKDKLESNNFVLRNNRQNKITQGYGIPLIKEEIELKIRWLIMEIKDFEVKTTKLNMIHFPDCNEKRYILLKINSNLDILLPEENKQKIFLTYNIKSNDLPFDIMWECKISLTSNEKFEQKITQEEFLKCSEVIAVIEKHIEQISLLADMELPSFSKGIGE